VLFNIYNCDAGTAKLHVLVVIMSHVGYGGEILADELA
jgi:hypothetical protein